LEADKNFYEEALEARTNQLEEMERRCEDLEMQLAAKGNAGSEPQNHNPRALRELDDKA